MGAIANLWKAIRGVFDSNAVTDAAAQLLLSIPVTGATTAAATAGTGLVDTPIPGAHVNRAGRFKSGRWVMDSGTTAAASATDYATIQVYRQKGSSTYLIATLSTATNSFQSGTSLPLVMNATNPEYTIANAGDRIGHNITKASSGVAVYAGSLVLEFEQTD